MRLKRKAIFPPTPKRLGGPENEINLENGTQREEDQDTEIDADHPLEIETVTNGDNRSRNDGPFIKPKRRAEASPLEKGVNLVGKYSLASMLYWELKIPLRRIR